LRKTLSWRRRWLDRLFLVMTGGATLLGLALLFLIFLMVVLSGKDALSWTFLTERTAEAGAAGGIFYQICGTLLLSVTAAALAMPLSLALALVQSEYLKHPSIRRALGTLLYLLNGVPSIVFGVFGYFVLVRGAGFEKSWLVGGMVLALMIVPTVTISVSDAIKRIPSQDRDAVMALGLNPPKVIWALVLPYSLNGLVTGTLLGLARAAGETAPIMFTAAVASGADFPTGIVDNPVVAIPYHILELAQDASNPKILTNAWGSALVLLFISIMFSSLGWLIRQRSFQEDQR
jgi:phosphate transport system permease protein